MSFESCSKVITMGIDALQVGTVVVFKLPAITDKTSMGYQPLEPVLAKDIKKVEKSVNKTEPLVGVIKRRIETGDFPVFDVAFFTRYSGGAISGYLELKEIMIWRYFADPTSPGKPPKWFKRAVLSSDTECKEFAGVPTSLIHWLKNVDSSDKNLVKRKYIVKRQNRSKDGK